MPNSQCYKSLAAENSGQSVPKIDTIFIATSPATQHESEDFFALDSDCEKPNIIGQGAHITDTKVKAIKPEEQTELIMISKYQKELEHVENSPSPTRSDCSQATQVDQGQGAPITGTKANAINMSDCSQTTMSDSSQETQKHDDAFYICAVLALYKFTKDEDILDFLEGNTFQTYYKKVIDSNEKSAMLSKHTTKNKATIMKRQTNEDKRVTAGVKALVVKNYSRCIKIIMETNSKNEYLKCVEKSKKILERKLKNVSLTLDDLEKIYQDVQTFLESSKRNYFGVTTQQLTKRWPRVWVSDENSFSEIKEFHSSKKANATNFLETAFIMFYHYKDFNMDKNTNDNKMVGGDGKFSVVKEISQLLKKKNFYARCEKVED